MTAATGLLTVNVGLFASHVSHELFRKYAKLVILNELCYCFWEALKHFIYLSAAVDVVAFSTDAFLANGTGREDRDFLNLSSFIES